MYFGTGSPIADETWRAVLFCAAGCSWGVCLPPSPCRAGVARPGSGVGSAARPPRRFTPAARPCVADFLGASCARAALLAARGVLQPRLPFLGGRRGLRLGGPSLGVPCLPFPCLVAAQPASPAASPLLGSRCQSAGGRRAVWYSVPIPGCPPSPGSLPRCRAAWSCAPLRKIVFKNSSGFPVLNVRRDFGTGGTLRNRRHFSASQGNWGALKPSCPRRPEEIELC